MKQSNFLCDAQAYSGLSYSGLYQNSTFPVNLNYDKQAKPGPSVSYKEPFIRLCLFKRHSSDKPLEPFYSLQHLSNLASNNLKLQECC